MWRCELSYRLITSIFWKYRFERHFLELPLLRRSFAIHSLSLICFPSMRGDETSLSTISSISRSTGSNSNSDHFFFGSTCIGAGGGGTFVSVPMEVPRTDDEEAEKTNFAEECSLGPFEWTIGNPTIELLIDLLWSSVRMNLSGRWIVFFVLILGFFQKFHLISFGLRLSLLFPFVKQFLLNLREWIISNV